MQHYLYVTDADGEEIPGSRNCLDRVTKRDQIAALETVLVAKIGECCSIKDNVEDWRTFWAVREAAR